MIQILDPTVAAQIAAGEVVERPASVAKELIENAIDAGAKHITISVRGGGLRELKIQDDGCGISAEEVELAFQRHATSKLRSADDLWALVSLGFRGEALPSIASVAQVICVTRTAEAPTGTELRVAGGEVQDRTTVSCSPGTTFSIRNLFYNVPVRREFLRSEAAETSAITAIVTQYALGYPEIRFTLVRDDKTVFQTNGTGDLRAAVLAMYGLELARQLLDVSGEEGGVASRGLISPPGVTRASRDGMHLFVNRRAIQPRGPLAAKIIDAYHTSLMKGRFPFTVLNLDVHPSTVDVNIHPTKSEVKFRGREAPLIDKVMTSAVRAALFQTDAVLPWRDEKQAAREAGGADVQQKQAPQPGAAAAQTANFFDDDSSLLPPPIPRPNTPYPTTHANRPGQRIAEGRAEMQPPAGQDSVERRADLEAPTRLGAGLAALAAERRTGGQGVPSLRPLAQLGLAYILAEGPNQELYIIDQHAAHERITYERLMAQRGAGAIESQALLTPEDVELPPAAQQILRDSAEELAEWGFAIEDFGSRLRVRSIPASVALAELQPALLEVADHLSGSGGATPADRREKMLTTLACHTSVRFGQSLSPVEMQELIDRLAGCELPRTCPHGRPTVIMMTTAQLARQFGRLH
jgi:DNA mismatch repair protein MutL